MTDEWYEALRNEYRPRRVNILLVGESSPDPGSGDRRFFYCPVLSAHDNLYRGVAEAFYGGDAAFDVRDKAAVLSRLRDDGIWLVDAVAQPINNRTTAARRAAVRAGLGDLIETCRALEVERGVIVSHGPVVRDRGRAAASRRYPGAARRPSAVPARQPPRPLRRGSPRRPGSSPMMAASGAAGASRAYAASLWGDSKEHHLVADRAAGTGRHRGSRHD